MKNKAFGARGFFGGMPFGGENLHEKWSKMTEEEKKAFVEERVNQMNEMMAQAGEHEREMTVEAMDKRCEQWMALSAEEKEAFVNERKERMQQFAAHGMCGHGPHHHGHPFHHRFGF